MLERIVSFALFGLIAWWLGNAVAKWLHPDQWDGFVYPSRHDLSVHRNIGEFPSLDTRRAAAIDTLRSISSVQAGDYECGLNCKWSSSLTGIKVCEKTER